LDTNLNLHAHFNFKLLSERTCCQVVPARGGENVSISFNPSSLSTIPADGLDCRSFCLGYMTLPKSRHEVDGQQYRQHQYDMPPLVVNMTGRIMRASLGVEFHDDDAMSYIIPASDLLDDDNQVRSSSSLSSLSCHHHRHRPKHLQCAYCMLNIGAFQE